MSSSSVYMSVGILGQPQPDERMTMPSRGSDAARQRSEPESQNALACQVDECDRVRCKVGTRAGALAEGGSVFFGGDDR